MSQSRILLIVAFAVAVLLGRFLFVHAPKTGSTDAAQPAAEAESAIPTEETDAAGAPAAVKAPEALSAADGSPAAAARVEAALAAAAELRRKARFPPTSRRIEDNLDPLLQKITVKEHLSPRGQGRKPTLVLFASATSYEAPNPISLFARFIGEYPNDWSTLTGGEIVGELRNSAAEVVAEVDLRDDGQGRDIEAGDGVYTTEITPATEDLGQWNGVIRVKVYGETADGDRRTAKTRFYYGAPTARLTGYYQDKLVDGHLQIMAEVEVKEAGDYRLQGSLTGQHANLLAWAENTVHFDPGVGLMPLTFWGLALREANVPGPYQLGSIALANVSYKPPQLNDAFNPGYQTAAYDPEDFSEEPYNDPKLLEKADRYEARARR